ncbi:MAG TPA: hypothetical protein DEG44_04990 [Candidatus Kerfeldbacteria bacterium]|nr:hypothetical protein [Candidatus Kerfeldbacteria bacterium]
MKRSDLFRYIIISFFAFGIVVTPLWAANLGNIKTKTIIMVGKVATLQRKGAQPVTVKDNLAVRGNITLPANRTVDGVDVSSLNTIVAALTGLPAGCTSNQVAKFDGDSWECGNDIDTDTDTDTDTNTTYTAGTGIAITNGVISSTVVDTDTDTNTTYSAGTGITINGTTISASLGTSIDADELASTAIQAGDIETGDLPSLSSDNLTDVSSLAMLDEAESITANWVNTANPWDDNEVANSLTLTGGTINDVTIGATTASSGNFSSLSVRNVTTSLTMPSYFSRKAISAELAGQTFITAVAAVFGSDNLPFVVYGKASDAAIYSVTCNNEVCNDTIVSSLVTTTGAGGANQIDTVVGPDGYPQIAYYDSALGDLMFVDCSSLTCASGSNTKSTLDNSATAVGKSVDMIIGSDGFPQIAYIDDTNDDLKIFDCGNATCSSGNTTSTVDSGNIGVGVAFASALDGRGVMVYETSGSPDVLTYGRCDNATCTAITTATIDASAVIGKTPAITMSDNLVPIIVFVDDTNVITIYCGNITCDSGRVATTQYASASSVDDYVDITIGADGQPLFSFSDYANGASGPLYITYCGNNDCSSAANVDVQQTNAASLNSAGEQNLLIRQNGLPSIVVGGDILEMLSANNKFFADYWTRE